MNLEAIHGKLKAKFGDGIIEWSEPETGDGWIEVEPGAWREVAECLRHDDELAFDFLRLLTGVDYPEFERIEAVYHLLSYKHDHEAAIKVRTPRDNPVVASVMDLWRAAEWHERETYDMLGLKFEGHTNLTRILLPDDWVGYPLRKDYKQPDEYHGISNW